MAEVSKDKGPIGRGCAEFNWFESQLMSDSMEVRFNGSEIQWKNDTFLRDFLQKCIFEDQKRSFCARLLSKMKL